VVPNLELVFIFPKNAEDTKKIWKNFMEERFNLKLLEYAQIIWTRRFRDLTDEHRIAHDIYYNPLFVSNDIFSSLL
jgi:hypothetical protein